MGQEVIYKCKKCGNEFLTKEGCGNLFCLYRCVNCDSVKPGAIHKSKNNIGRCEKCGGELREDLKPMCKKCKSRDVEEKEILALWD